MIDISALASKISVLIVILMVALFAALGFFLLLSGDGPRWVAWVGIFGSIVIFWGLTGWLATLAGLWSF